jgi:hypothetical protein
MPNYDFKLYEETPQVWVPVMFARGIINMSFTAPDPTWTAQDFKVFQVNPADPYYNTGFPGVNTAEEAKTYIMNLYTSAGNWSTPWGIWDNSIYNSGSPTLQDTFRLTPPNPNGPTLTIQDRRNRGLGAGNVIVFDFILHYTDGTGADVLVDPRVRNEY